MPQTTDLSFPFSFLVCSFLKRWLIFFYWTKVSKWVGTFPIREQCLYKRWGPTVNLPCFLSLFIYPTNYYDLEFEPYFIKKKILHWPSFSSLYWIFYDIAPLLCFGFFVARHVGSYLPSQGSNLHPFHWKAVLTTGLPGKSVNFI